MKYLLTQLYKIIVSNNKNTGSELLASLKGDSRQAIGKLYDKYAPLIYGIILREVDNDLLAKNILTTTFVNVISECKTIECINQSIFTWLLSITKKTAASHHNVELDFKLMLLNRTSKQSHTFYTAPLPINNLTSSQTIVN